MKAKVVISSITLLAFAAEAFGHVPTAKEIGDFQDVTPKAAKSPPGIYVCWGDNAVILTKPHWGYWEQGCAKRYAVVATQLQKRREELIANPSAQGCLGKDWQTCVATISVANQVTTSILNDELIPPTGGRDLDGELLPQSVWVDVFPTYNPTLPKAAQRADKIELRLDDNSNVKSVYVWLHSDPSQGKTRLDWDTTGVFEIARGVLGECVGDRLAFYKMYRDLSNGQTLSGYSTDTSYGTTGKAVGALCTHEFDVYSGSGLDINHGTHAEEGFAVEP